MSRDDAFVLDMLLAAEDAWAFCAGVAREDFMADRVLQYATVRALEIIGEAARHVSGELRLAQPEIPWAQIVATRHRIAHDYSHVDWTVVWEIVQKDLPGLVTALRAIVPPAEETAL